MLILLLQMFGLLGSVVKLLNLYASRYSEFGIV